MSRIKTPKIHRLTWQSSMTEFPDAWHKFQSLQAAERLPQVVLLTGVEQLAAQEFAVAMAASFYCGENSACGVCAACQNTSLRLQADLLLIEAEENSLKLEDASLVTEFLSLQANSATQEKFSRRICIISEVEKFTHQAVNSLLKILEEPPLRSFVILTSVQRKLLLPTLLSRCVVWDLGKYRAKSQAEPREGLAPSTEKALHNLLDPLANKPTALHAAEVLSKEIGLDIKSFLFQAEIVLNKYYRRAVAENSASFHGLNARRAALQELKLLALKKKIALNAQLSFETMRGNI